MRKVTKISDDTIRKLRNKSVATLPDNPSERGVSASAIKDRFVDVVVDGDQMNVVAQVNRVVDEANAALSEVETKFVETDTELDVMHGHIGQSGLHVSENDRTLWNQSAWKAEESKTISEEAKSKAAIAVESSEAAVKIASEAKTASDSANVKSAQAVGTAGSASTAANSAVNTTRNFQDQLNVIAKYQGLGTAVTRGANFVGGLAIVGEDNAVLSKGAIEALMDSTAVGESKLEGSVLTFQNTSKGMINDVIYYGQTDQHISPNLIVQPYESAPGTWYGITWSVNSNFSVTASGVPTNHSTFFLSTNVLDPGTYTSTPEVPGKVMFVKKIISDPPEMPYITASTFTLTKTTTIQFYLQVNKDQLPGTLSFYPMCVKGTALPAYEPYTGIPASDHEVPIRNVSSSFSVSTCGQNVLDEKKWIFYNQPVTRSGITGSFDKSLGAVVLNGTRDASNLNLELTGNIPIAAGDYTLVANCVEGSYIDSDAKYKLLQLQDETYQKYVPLNLTENKINIKTIRNTDFWLSVFNNIRLETGTNCNHIKFQIYLLVGNYTADNVPGYSPYQGKDYLIKIKGKNGKLYDLYGIEGVRDRVYTDDGVNWKLEKKWAKATINGTEEYTMHAMESETTKLFSLTSLLPGVKKYTVQNERLRIRYNRFQPSTNAVAIQEIECASIQETGTLFFRIKKTAAADSAALKAWLTTHPVEIIYELAAPQIVDLEPLPEMSTYDGATTILSTSSLPALLEAREFSHRSVGERVVLTNRNGTALNPVTTTDQVVDRSNGGLLRSQLYQQGGDIQALKSKNFTIETSLDATDQWEILYDNPDSTSLSVDVPIAENTLYRITIHYDKTLGDAMQIHYHVGTKPSYLMIHSEVGFARAKMIVNTNGIGLGEIKFMTGTGALPPYIVRVEENINGKTY